MMEVVVDVECVCICVVDSGCFLGLVVTLERMSLGYIDRVRYGLGRLELLYVTKTVCLRFRGGMFAVRAWV